MLDAFRNTEKTRETRIPLETPWTSPLEDGGVINDYRGILKYIVSQGSEELGCRKVLGMEA